MNPCDVRSRVRCRALLLALAAASLPSVPACYRHVTDAKGIGSDEYTIHPRAEDNTILNDPDAPRSSDDR